MANLRRCPYCLQWIRGFEKANDATTGQEYFRCTNSNCGKEIPFLYVKDYEKYPLVILSLMGLRKTGKTVFIHCLLYEIERLGRFWNTFQCSPLDQRGMRDIYSKIAGLSKGSLPPATDKNFREPMILQMEDIPNVGSCRLLMYDTGGEAFEADTFTMVSDAPYITESPVVAWLVDITETTPFELQDILIKHIEIFSRNPEKIKSKKLIIIVTKGDKLLQDERFPDSCRMLLTNNIMPSGDDLYSLSIRTAGSLETISTDLENWLDTTGYHNFVRKCRKEYTSVKYCVISSLGSDPQGQIQQVSVNPRGVLLPLFWLWFHRSTQGKIRLGTQTFFSLEHAITQAKENDEIVLSAGEFTLSKTIVIKKSLSIIGPKDGVAKVSCSDAGVFVFDLVLGRLKCSDVRLEHRSSLPGNCLSFRSGHFELINCSFSSVCETRNGDLGGVGFLVEEANSGYIESCSFTGSSRHGAVFGNVGKLDITDCTFQQNLESGALVKGNTGCRISRCRFENNGKQGIYVRSNRDFLIEESIFGANDHCGIAVGSSSIGKIILNNCSGNGRSGICISGRANAMVQNNECRENKEAGILLLEKAVGYTDGNICMRNLFYGIAVSRDADHTFNVDHLDENGKKDYFRGR